MNLYRSLCLLLLLPFLLPAQEDANALSGIEKFIQEQQDAGTIDLSEKNWRMKLPKFPEVEFPAGGEFVWTLETSEGTMKAVLNHEAAPNHVRNIVYLTLLGFYDGLVFHRIIPGFMAQGGCPAGNGRGNPGYGVVLEVKAGVRHKGPGVLSMARSAHPDSAGSQFFITFGDTPHLDGQYSVFGQVTEGKEVIKKLEAAGNPNPRMGGVPPLKVITIERATVTWVELTEDPS